MAHRYAVTWGDEHDTPGDQSELARRRGDAGLARPGRGVRRAAGRARSRSRGGLRHRRRRLRRAGEPVGGARPAAAHVRPGGPAPPVAERADPAARRPGQGRATSPASRASTTGGSRSRCSPTPDGPRSRRPRPSTSPGCGPTSSITSRARSCDSWERRSKRCSVGGVWNRWRAPERRLCRRARWVASARW